MLPQRLKELRRIRNLSARDLSARFHVAESTISGYETGARTPELALLEKFADFYDVSVDYLLGREAKSSTSSQGEQAQNLIDLPEVQFIMRTKTKLSPKAYAKFLELSQKTAEIFADDGDDEDDRKR